MSFLYHKGCTRCGIGAEMIAHPGMDFIFDNTPIYREFGFVPKPLIPAPNRRFYDICRMDD